MSLLSCEVSSLYTHVVLSPVFGIYCVMVLFQESACEHAIGQPSFMESGQCLEDRQGAKVTQELCLPSTKQAAKQISAAVKRTGHTSVYIATDAHPDFTQLQAALGSKVGEGGEEVEGGGEEVEGGGEEVEGGGEEVEGGGEEVEGGGEEVEGGGEEVEGGGEEVEGGGEEVEGGGEEVEGGGEEVEGGREEVEGGGEEVEGGGEEVEGGGEEVEGGGEEVEGGGEEVEGGGEEVEGGGEEVEGGGRRWKGEERRWKGEGRRIGKGWEEDREGEEVGGEERWRERDRVSVSLHEHVCTLCVRFSTYINVRYQQRVRTCIRVCVRFSAPLCLCE